jgi:hypothetical protein
VLAPERIGEAALRASFQVAAGSSPYATHVCVDAWLTDFRGDLPKSTSRCSWCTATPTGSSRSG